MINCYDAIGNEIEMNATYGYNRSPNGSVKNMIGSIIKINDDGTVQLEISKTYKALYADKVELVDGDTKVTTLKSNRLFKL